MRKNRTKSDMFAPGIPPPKVFVSCEGRGKYKHLNCDETTERLLNRDGRVGLGLRVGEYRLIKIHRIILRAEAIKPKR